MHYRFFLAGIIQGSKQGFELCDQTYRDRLKSILKQGFTNCELLCPVEEHPNSIRYTDEEARATFFTNVQRAKDSTALVVYLPEASMGSGIEMWEAYRAGIPIFTITPMLTNWVIRILSSRIFPNLEAFEEFVLSGEMKKMLDAYLIHSTHAGTHSK